MSKNPIESVSEDPILITAQGSFTGEMIQEAVSQWKSREPHEELTGKVVAHPGEYTLEALSFLLYAKAENRFIVAPISWGDETRHALIQQLKPDILWKGSAETWEGWETETASGHDPLIKSLRGAAGLLLATTGTTGERKWVLHDLPLFVKRYENKQPLPVRVLPLMTPAHIGGQDIFWRSWFARATLVVPEASTPEGVGKAVETHRVTFLAATPSYLRGLWIRGVFSEYDWGSVGRITYGGERMPLGLLEQLQTALPHVRWEQRYGMSELSTFSTKEAGEGFLRLSPSSAEWKVVEGELWVKRPRSWIGYLHEIESDPAFHPESWFSTGDRVEEREDGALRILGRKGLFINVGGEKVSPEEVEAVVYTFPGVLECRAYPHQDSLMGQVVALDLLVSEDRKHENWRLIVRKGCQGKLPRAAIPVRIHLLDRKEIDWKLKLSRGDQ